VLIYWLLREREKKDEAKATINTLLLLFLRKAISLRLIFWSEWVWSGPQHLSRFKRLYSIAYLFDPLNLSFLSDFFAFGSRYFVCSCFFRFHSSVFCLTFFHLIIFHKEMDVLSINRENLILLLKKKDFRFCFLIFLQSGIFLCFFSSFHMPGPYCFGHALPKS
jgi:hypothetical protein